MKVTISDNMLNIMYNNNPLYKIVQPYYNFQTILS